MDAALDIAGQPRLYAARARGIEFASGIVLACLGCIVIWFSVVSAGLRGDRELLLGIGVAMALLGALLAWVGARRRRLTVQSDGQGLSQPWAMGKPRIAWSEIGQIGISMLGNVWVAERDGRVRLRIARDLDDYDRLVDAVCDQLTVNSGPPVRGIYKSRFGSSIVSVGETVVELATAGGREQLELSEIQSAFIDIDERLCPAMALVLKSGEIVRVPYLGSRHTLDLYRSLRLRAR